MDQLLIRFCSYVQVWEPSMQTNSMKLCSQGAIALGPLPTLTTGYVFMALDTGKIIIRSQFKDSGSRGSSPALFFLLFSPR